MPTGALNVKRNDYLTNPKDFEIFTLPDICNFIYDIVSVNNYKKIADICCGSGNLSVPFAKNGCDVVGVDTVDYSKKFPGLFMQFDFTDINPPLKKLKKDAKKEEQNAYMAEIRKRLNKTGLAKDGWLKLKAFNPDLILTNPPWNRCPSKKLYPFEMLIEIMACFGFETPTVLFTPMGLRLNRRYGAKRAALMENLIQNGCEITSICSMPIDAFSPGNKEKGQQWEILFFNIPNIKPHYWYTEKTREKYTIK